MERSGWGDADVARSYAQGFARASEQHVPHLVRAVAAAPATRALDLCCGHGIVTEELARTGAAVTALDFSPAMLLMARERVLEATFVEGDASDLPFGDATFDAVTIGLGVLHMARPDRALREARRVLVRGGRIALTCWLGPDRSFAMRIVSEAIAKHGDPNVAMPEAPPNFAFAEEEVALPALREAGFTKAEMTIIDSHWIVDDPGAPFDLFMHGTVRVGELLHRQPAGALPAIRAAVVEAVHTELGPEGPWRVPVPAAMASAAVPEDEAS